MSTPNLRHGYIALASALIISLLLAILTFDSGTSALLTRFDTLDYADHLQARSLAISCLYAAAFSITFDPAYRVPSTGIDVFIGNPSTLCHIQNITVSGLVGTVTASASVRHASAHVEGKIAIPRLPAVPTITSWKEMNAL
ncbi:MAG: hypothetical protein JWL88_6 [Parcubacteria group bacterium]|nr:hypothetical protein [Parcubacteria group bacterium]